MKETERTEKMKGKIKRNERVKNKGERKSQRGRVKG